jgi:hypothetical protein
MSFRRHAAMGAVLAVMVPVAGLAPAHAEVFDKGHFAFERSVEEELCGIAVRADTVASGHFRDRTGKHELDQAFFSQASFEFTDTITDLATGDSFSVEGRLTIMDVKAIPLGGNVFEFKVRESGTVVVRDMEGNVVLHDRGAIWRTFVFDTLGDSQPGGVVLEEIVDRVSGPHPLFEQDEAAFCDMVHDLIG